MESMTGHSSQMSTHYTTVAQEDQSRLIQGARALAQAASDRERMGALTPAQRVQMEAALVALEVGEIKGES